MSRLALAILTAPERVGDAFEVAVRHVPCALCDHSRDQHRHYRAGLDCSPRGGCLFHCRAFVWPSLPRIARIVWASR